jgi:hypothetical protein
MISSLCIFQEELLGHPVLPAVSVVKLSDQFLTHPVACCQDLNPLMSALLGYKPVFTLCIVHPSFTDVLLYVAVILCVNICNTFLAIYTTAIIYYSVQNCCQKTI